MSQRCLPLKTRSRIVCFIGGLVLRHPQMDEEFVEWRSRDGRSHGDKPPAAGGVKARSASRFLKASSSLMC